MLVTLGFRVYSTTVYEGATTLLKDTLFKFREEFNISKEDQDLLFQCVRLLSYIANFSVRLSNVSSSLLILTILNTSLHFLKQKHITTINSDYSPK